jgi:chromosome partitioning protein
MSTPTPTGPLKIIAVGGLKGGIGKSTLAMFIAFLYATIFGQRVLLVDADPSSQTAYDWWNLAHKRGNPLPFDIETWPHARVGEMVLQRATGKYDVVVMDCGGDSDAILASAVAVCHFALIATTAFPADVRRVAPTFHSAAKAAQEAGRADEVTPAVVFLKVDNRQAVQNEARKDKVAERLPILDAQMSYRPRQYAEAFSEGVPPEDDLTEVKAIVTELGAAS